MSLVVVVATGPISIQGAPRTGRMHEGVPPGGAILPSRLAAANRAVGNREDAPAIEVFGILVLRAETRVDVATSEGPHTLEPGDELRVAETAWTYVAVRGGLAGPTPGLVTTPLRKGERIVAGREPRVRSEAAHRRAPAPAGHDLTGPDPVRVLPGPDLDAFGPDVLAILVAAPYDVVMPARTGARLRGAVLPRRAGLVERSRPMVRGAIEVPGDGQPIVLGPDHPTTGGYPILGVVATDDLARVFGAARVQFTT